MISALSWPATIVIQGLSITVLRGAGGRGTTCSATCALSVSVEIGSPESIHVIGVCAVTVWPKFSKQLSQALKRGHLLRTEAKPALSIASGPSFVLR